MRKVNFNLRHALLLLLAAVCAVLILSAITACNSGKSVKYFTVEYVAGEGGYIDGETEQVVESGKDCTAVTAVSSEGYIFTGWSDGVETAERQDGEISEDLTVTALFAKEYWSVTYTSNNYLACNLTEPDEYTVKHGETTSITVEPVLGYKFVGWSDGVTAPTRTDDYTKDGQTIEAIFEMDFINLPVISIDTDGKAITSKEDYVDCTVSLLNVDDEYLLDELVAGIRLRGNSTFNLSKKPYRIKFDKKQSPFGWEKNKSWVLLALYLDYSNIKDYAARVFANAIGTEAFVPNAQHVEVYLNGTYQGLYLFTDQVSEHKGRTNVEDEDFFDTDSVEVPFLVEWDEYSPKEGPEDEVWFKIENSDITSYYNVKYPEFDDGYNYTQEQFEYIKNYIITVNDICRNPDVTQAEFEEWIDLPAFIDYYLIQEVMSNGEVNKKSVFMSRAVGGKLVMGPLWDFDWGAGGPIGRFGGVDYQGKTVVQKWRSSTNWFAYMLKVDWFKEKVIARWDEITSLLLETVDELVAFKPEIEAVAKRNAIRWEQNKTGQFTDFDEYYDWVVDYMKLRIEIISGLLAD